MAHRTRSVPIKNAEVDEKILPVVLWLNTYRSVYTIFSCEGDERGDPYVLFTCSSLETLYDIQRTIMDANHPANSGGTRVWGVNRMDDIKVYTNMFESVLRFNMRFKDKNALRAFCAFLLDNHIDIVEE